MKGSKPLIVMVSNVYHPIMGGISNYIKSLVNGLQKRGYLVKVLSYPPHLVLLESGELRKSARIAFHMFFVIYSFICILGLRLKFKNIVVHGHSANFCLLTVSLSKFIGCKGVHTFHSPIKKSDFILKYVSPRVDAILFVSPPHKESYITKGKVYNKRIELAPGAVDTQKFYPVSDDEKRILRKKFKYLGLKEDRPLVFFLGRLVEDKGVHILIDSIPETRRSVPNLQVLIAGASPDTSAAKTYFSRIRNQIKDLELEDIILLRPNLVTDIIPDLFRSSDIFICPSLWEEPSGITVVEALSSGLPVIASNIGGLPHRVRDHITGYIIEPGDSSSLGKSIIDILANKELKANLSLNARKEAEELYSIDRFIKHHIDLYQSIS